MDAFRRCTAAVLAALLLPALAAAQEDAEDDEDITLDVPPPAPLPANAPKPVVTGPGVAGTEPYRALPAFAEKDEHVFLVCETPHYLAFWYEAFRERGAPPEQDERFLLREKERGYIKAFEVQAPRDDRGAGAPRRELAITEPGFHAYRFTHAVVRGDRLNAVLDHGNNPRIAERKASDPRYALVARAFEFPDVRDTAMLDDAYKQATEMVVPRGRATITWTPGARTADLRLELLLHPIDTSLAVESGRCVASDPDHLGDAIRETAGAGMARDALFNALFGDMDVTAECEKAAGKNAARRKACATELAEAKAELVKSYREMTEE